MNPGDTADRDHFPRTRWSIVLGAQGDDEAVKARALSELCEMYWYPLYAYVRRCGLSPADAEDATQGFVCELLAKDRVRLFSESKGKLRAYLLSSIKNFLRDQWKAESRKKRGGTEQPLSFEVEVAEDRYAGESSKIETPEKLFEVRWALTVLDRVYERVGEEYERLGKPEVFDALKGLLGGERDVPLASIGEELGISEGAARVTLFRMRKQYRRFLEEEIAETLAEDESIEEEIRHLHQVFAQ